MELDVSHLLAELVAIPSVNPMGRDNVGTLMLESRMTDFLERWFSRLRLPTVRQTVEPQRDNILARLDGNSDAPLIMFDAHQDTVPAEGMSIDPFGAVIRDGRLYGRGACDIKGGMASMLAAFGRLAADPPARRPTVIMSCTVNEEHGFTGARAVCRLWGEGDRSIFPRMPDYAIVAEPTDLEVVVAHKGMVRWKCRTHGRAAHSSRPDQGQNAIYRMARVVAALERYQRELLEHSPEHPLCGRPTLSVGTIHGGISVNTVPDCCTIEIDRRLLPDDVPAQKRQHVIDYLAQQSNLGDSIEHLPPMMESRGLSDTNNGALAAQLATAAREVRGTANTIGVPFGTNATAYGAHFPTVVFGPGSIAQAHTADEWVALDQVEQASEILYRFLKRVAD
jgi:acetylornithine deacetylase/succinyl-diaminopimelate desuccinylase family protein